MNSSGGPEQTEDGLQPTLRRQITMLGAWSDAPTSDRTGQADEAQLPALESAGRRRRGSRASVRSILSWRPTTVLAVLLAAGVGLVFLDLGGAQTQSLRSLGHTVGGGAQRWADGAVGPLRDLPERRTDAREYRERVAELEARNNVLEAERAALIDREFTKSGTTKLRRWASERKVSVVPSHVVASAIGIASSHSVTLDIGAKAGIEPDLSVVADGALVGRIVDVGPNTSTLLLITDPSNRVWGRTQRSRAPVVVDGADSGLRLGLVNQFAKVRVGETISTMGSPNGKPYPRGIPIGTIASIDGNQGALDRSIAVEPITDLVDLDLVGIVTGKQRSS